MQGMGVDPHLIAPDRLRSMSEWIRERRMVTVQELTERFDVSDMTVRRDLEKLERSGAGFQRVHGGVVWQEVDVPIDRRESEHTAEKRRIAERCLELVRPGETIILDSGTTTFEIAAALAEHPEMRLTVITAALNVAYRLRTSHHVTLVMPGGEFRTGTQSLVGSVTRTFFETLYADQAFVSTTGIHLEAGFTNANFAEVEIKQHISRACHRLTYVSDSSKFGQRSPYVFAQFTDGARIVTDRGVGPEWGETLRERGVLLDIV